MAAAKKKKSVKKAARRKAPARKANAPEGTKAMQPWAHLLLAMKDYDKKHGARTQEERLNRIARSPEDREALGLTGPVPTDTRYLYQMWHFIQQRMNANPKDFGFSSKSKVICGSVMWEGNKRAFPSTANAAKMRGWIKAHLETAKRHYKTRLTTKHGVSTWGEVPLRERLLTEATWTQPRSLLPQQPKKKADPSKYYSKDTEAELMNIIFE